jgi:hypothetical protein
MIAAEYVLGLAFVFYASDPMVTQLNWMAITFQVSSFFNTCKMIKHSLHFHHWPL